MLTNSVLTSLPNLFGLPIESINAALFGLGDLGVDASANANTMNGDLMAIVGGWATQLQTIFSQFTESLPDLLEVAAEMSTETAEKALR
jgi:hypothetical protein